VDIVHWCCRSKAC